MPESMTSILLQLTAAGYSESEAIRVAQAIQADTAEQVTAAAQTWFSFLRRNLLGVRLIKQAAAGAIFVRFDGTDFHFEATPGHEESHDVKRLLADAAGV